ncbi:cysteine proteinase [Panus rudis PR-1116 ss-1]|nr:cysteine proteinase [Panus rudis PR-1116 ss-1]
MVLDTLSLVLPWNWSFGHDTSSTRKNPRKKLVRTRAEQVGTNGDAAGLTHARASDEGYYPGIVNISGTYCFMDSTLQAMASLVYLQPYIDTIHAKAEELDVPTPVVDALRDILHTLNTPNSSPRAIRPVDLIEALSRHSQGKHNPLFSSREHQDAQELFQLISECIKSEASAVDKEDSRDRGLGAALEQQKSNSTRELAKSVFDGLTANRRSCVQCGYTEAVMHFAFDNWQLAVPRASACYLEDCLADYTRLEILDDCICRKCSMIATYHRLQQEAKHLTEASSGSEASASKKKRAREARKLEARLRQAIEEGRIEEDIKGVQMEKVFSKASTKQAMIARPPPVLTLHLNRSVHFGHYATKNTCRVVFPEILDLTPYTTSGKLSTQPQSPISSPPPLPQQLRSTTPTQESSSHPRVLYRLSAVVVHYGQHSFGHYVCYRRKPRPVSYGSKRFAPPRMACPYGCECERCEKYGPIRDDDLFSDKKGAGVEGIPSVQTGPGRGWLRISDESVQEVGFESLRQEGSGVFMLYYERVLPYQPLLAHPQHTRSRTNGTKLEASTSTSTSTSIPIREGESGAEGGGQIGVYSSTSPRSSEETLKPRTSATTTRADSASASAYHNASLVSLLSTSTSSTLSSSPSTLSSLGSSSTSFVYVNGSSEANGAGAESSSVVTAAEPDSTTGPPGASKTESIGGGTSASSEGATTSTISSQPSSSSASTAPIPTSSSTRAPSTLSTLQPEITTSNPNGQTSDSADSTDSSESPHATSGDRIRSGSSLPPFHSTSSPSTTPHISAHAERSLDASLPNTGSIGEGEINGTGERDGEKGRSTREGKGQGEKEKKTSAKSFVGARVVRNVSAKRRDPGLSIGGSIADGEKVES